MNVKKYSKPEVVFIKIDSDISMIMMSGYSQFEGPHGEDRHEHHHEQQCKPDYGPCGEFDIANGQPPFPHKPFPPAY